jgi:hypothetical protein
MRCQIAGRRLGIKLLVPGFLLLPSFGALSPRVASSASFIRGDVDGDTRVLASDALGILHFLFRGDPDRVCCLDAADVDDDGSVTMSDAVYLLNSLFLGGAPPLAPFPLCGADPTEDLLDCRSPCSPTLRFAGQEYAADGVFFVVDRSTSMQDSGELQVARRELLHALHEMRGVSQLGIIFFDARVISFPPDRPPADGSSRGTIDGASIFVTMTPGGAGSCVREALLAALEFVELSTASRNLILYLGDGGGTCGGNEVEYLAQTLQAVSEANDGRAEIHTIGVMMAGRRSQELFLRALAETNGGTYTPLE